MLSFENDYIQGCHESILQALGRTNFEAEPGYGADRYSCRAAEKIREACHCEDAEVYFIAGGTQTNQLVIGTLLDSHEGVLSAKTGHIACHEAGAIEYSGHKVLELPQVDGKLRAEDLQNWLECFHADASRDHLVFPGMVYLSHPTEYGTLYTARELGQIRQVCDQYDLRLYIDGARLGYALGVEDSDVSLPLLAQLCDAFYIGGTKVGALCGEALVFPKGGPKQFLTKVKQRGAMLAKGRLIGIQFDTLFTDDLYFRLGRHGVQMAQEIKQEFLEFGFPLYKPTISNQVFVVLTGEEKKILEKHLGFTLWEPLNDGRFVVRLAGSWATSDCQIQELREILQFCTEKENIV